MCSRLQGLVTAAVRGAAGRGLRRAASQPLRLTGGRGLHRKGHCSGPRALLLPGRELASLQDRGRGLDEGQEGKDGGTLGEPRQTCPKRP